MYTCKFICMCVCMFVCMYLYMNLYMYVCMYVTFRPVIGIYQNCKLDSDCKNKSICYNMLLQFIGQNSKI